MDHIKKGDSCSVIGQTEDYSDTERKKLELELESQKKFLKTMIDAIPDLIFYKDTNSVYLGCNKAFAEQFIGLNEAEIIGKTDRDFVKDIELANFFRQKDIEMLNAGETRSNEESIQLANGKIIKIETQKSPYFDERGQVGGLIGISRDITERKLLENELKRKEKVITAVAMSIKALLENRNYFEAIETCFEMLGKATEVDRVYLFKNDYDELGLGKSSQVLEWCSETCIPQIDNPALQNIPFDKMGKLFMEGKAFYCLVSGMEQGKLRQRLESQDILSVIKFPIYVRGKFWGCVGFDECKYERHWSEADFSILSAFANSVERAIQRSLLEEELVIARRAAEAANIAKSNFLANMSHEIRTPMNGILGFLQLLESTEINEEQKEFIQIMKGSTDTLLNVINDILDISKIEAGMIELESIPFDLPAAVEAVVMPLILRAREKGIEINILVRAMVPQFVIGDPTRLKQVITNLVGNAIKFTEEGEVLVEVSLEDNDNTASPILFIVKDTGIGISDEAVKRLFKPFSQADSSSTRKYGGTGLGLAISKSIVEMMRGEIKVESTEGKGTTISFIVPLKKAEGAQSQVVADYSVLKGKKIMVVDDNSTNRNIAKVYLQEAGCVVAEADRSTEAISKLVQTGNVLFSAVLVDYSMPIMNGYDLAAALKVIPATKEIPLILLTSMAKKGEAKSAKEQGFLGYLSKPYKKKELLDCISIVIQGKTLNENNGIDDKSALVTSNTAHEARFNSKLKILIAEDNEVNIKFLIKLLQVHGMSCDIAVDGEEAVKACFSKKYDLVFMDCQMPVMDGYDATRRIREAEGGHHLPIIAMTAYAMVGDAEKCKAAGMDDYLSKPIDFNKLMCMIQQYAVRDRVEDEVSYYDVVFERLVKGIGLDKESSKELLDEAIPEIAHAISEIELLIKNNNISDVLQVLHRFKGATGNLRMNEIADKVQKLEMAAHEGDIEKMKEISGEIRAMVELFGLC